MSTPRTPLLVAPDGEENLLGKSMLSDDLIRGLRKCNPSLVVPAPEDRYRTPTFKGITTLWRGAPFQKGSTKICAFHLGAIPEWTQVDAEGRMITRGWRAIFEKVVRSGSSTRARIEHVFRVNLSESSNNALCVKCIRDGKREPHNNGKLRMCDLHENVYTSAQKGRVDAPELLNRANWRKTKEIAT